MSLTVGLALVALALFYLALYGQRWLLRHAYALLAAKRYDDAVGAFERAAKLSRRSVYALLGLAAAHKAAGRPDAELAALDRALAADPTSMDAFDARVAAERERTGEGAVIVWLHQRASDERLPKVARAFALGQRGVFLAQDPARRTEAIADLEAAERVTPDPLLELALAGALVAAGRREEGIRWYETAANGAERWAGLALLALARLEGADDLTRRARERALVEAASLHGETLPGAVVRAWARRELGKEGAAEELAAALAALPSESRATWQARIADADANADGGSRT